MFENGKVFRLKARKREGKGREKETKLEVLHGNMFLQPPLRPERLTRPGTSRAGIELDPKLITTAGNTCLSTRYNLLV